MEAKGTKATLATVLESEIIERVKEVRAELDKATFYEIPEDFIYGAFLCMFSASKDSALGTMTCLHVKGKTLTTGDNQRGSEYIMKGEMDEFMIEASVAAELKVLEEIKITSYGISDAWVHFITAEETRLSVRRILGEFADYHTMISSIKGKKIKLPDGIKDTVDIASLIVEGHGVSMVHSIKIELSKNELKCVGTSETKGTIEKTTVVSYDGADVSFFISPSFLIEVMNKATTIIINEDNTKALFRSERFKHVMVLPF